MDFDRSQQPTQTYQETPPAPVHTEPKKKGGGKKLVMFLFILILMAAAAGAGWYYRDMEAKDAATEQQTKIDELEAQNAALKKELTEAEASGDTAPVKPSQATLDNISDAVKSGNYAALQQLMAEKVTVIIAASEGIGERTPAQAVVDIKYLDAGTDPWNFALSAATIDSYQDGDYTKYFPDSAHVGKSANNYVVSFTFDDAGKISGIFMAANAAEL